MKRTTALSIAEAKSYLASSASAADEISREVQTPVFENNDNTACNRVGNYLIGGHKSAKHIFIQRYFDHKAIQKGMMLLVQVPTASHLADIFKKGLHYQQFKA